MIEPSETERKLRGVTKRQCEILYWIFQGLDYIEIGLKLGFSEKTIQADMTKLYRQFGLRGKSMPEKRRILNAEVRPVYERLINEPGDCVEGITIIDELPADPKAVKEVDDDARRGLIPLERSLERVPVQPPKEEERKPTQDKPRGELIPRPGYPLVVYPPSRGWGNPLQWILVGVLAALLIVALIFFVLLFAAGGPDRLAYLFTGTPTPILQTIAVPQTVVVAQVPPTAAPTQPPSTVIVKVIVTVTPPPPTPTILPTATVLVEPSPTAAAATITLGTASGDMAGLVPDDIPGMNLALGSPVSSVVDYNTKLRDVYALDLTGGQEVRFAATIGSGCLNFILFNPGSKYVDTQNSEAFRDNCYSSTWKRNFIPAVSGTYYLDVRSNDSGQRYSISVQPTGTRLPAAQAPTDIPGVKLVLGTTVTSIVDFQTKVRDVYAIDLTAGQNVRFTASIDSGCLNFILFNPGSKSVEDNQNSEAFRDNCYSSTWQRDFTPAKSGTYYLDVKSNDTGQSYRLNVSVR